MATFAEIKNLFAYDKETNTHFLQVPKPKGDPHPYQKAGVEHPMILIWEEVLISAEEKGPQETLRFLASMVRYVISKTVALNPGYERQAFGAQCYNEFIDFTNEAGERVLKTDDDLSALSDVIKSLHQSPLSTIERDMGKFGPAIFHMPLLTASAQIALELDQVLVSQGKELTQGNRLEAFNTVIKPKLPIVT